VATGRPAGIHPLFLLPHLLAFRYNDGQFCDEACGFDTGLEDWIVGRELR